MHKNPANEPAIIKAKELAEVIKNSSSFKNNNEDEMEQILLECNDLITQIIKIDYNSACEPRGGCCG